MPNNEKPVCLITGLGDGTGGFTARRFAKAGYRIAMIARSEERLKRYENELPYSRGYTCDVSDLTLLEETCKRIKQEMSAPEVLIHNAVRGNFEYLLKGKPEWLETNFRINTTSLMYLAHFLVPDMIKQKKRGYYSHRKYCCSQGSGYDTILCPNKSSTKNFSPISSS